MLHQASFSRLRWLQVYNGFHVPESFCRGQMQFWVLTTIFRWFDCGVLWSLWKSENDAIWTQVAQNYCTKTFINTSLCSLSGTGPFEIRVKLQRLKSDLFWQLQKLHTCCWQLWLCIYYRKNRSDAGVSHNHWWSLRGKFDHSKRKKYSFIHVWSLE